VASAIRKDVLIAAYTQALRDLLGGL